MTSTANWNERTLRSACLRHAAGSCRDDAAISKNRAGSGRHRAILRAEPSGRTAVFWPASRASCVWPRSLVSGLRVRALTFAPCIMHFALPPFASFLHFAICHLPFAIYHLSVIRPTVARVDLQAIRSNLAAIAVPLVLEQHAGAAGDCGRQSQCLRARRAGGGARARARRARRCWRVPTSRRAIVLREAGVRAPILVFGALSVSDLDGVFTHASRRRSRHLRPRARSRAAARTARPWAVTSRSTPG